MTTGKNIKALRKQHGLTQNELASRIRSHQQNISKWENDESAPTFEYARKMAGIFHVPISQICDEYAEDPRCVIPDDGLETISRDIVIDYIDWNQKQGNRSIKATIISLSSIALSLFVSELAKYGIPGIVVLVIYVVAMILAIYFAKRIGLKKEMAAFSAIEAGDFHLDSEAEEMVKQRKLQIKTSVQTTGNLGTCGLILLLMWFIDTAYDAGWEFSNQAIIVYLIGLGIILALCMPTMNYWSSIKKLLHETGPQILTPFDKAFWKK